MMLVPVPCSCCGTFCELLHLTSILCMSAGVCELILYRKNVSIRSLHFFFLPPIPFLWPQTHAQKQQQQQTADKVFLFSVFFFRCCCLFSALLMLLFVTTPSFSLANMPHSWTLLTCVSSTLVASQSRSDNIRFVFSSIWCTFRQFGVAYFNNRLLFVYARSRPCDGLGATKLNDGVKLLFHSTIICLCSQVSFGDERLFATQTSNQSQWNSHRWQESEYAITFTINEWGKY